MRSPLLLSIAFAAGCGADGPALETGSYALLVSSWRSQVSEDSITFNSDGWVVTDVLDGACAGQLSRAQQDQLTDALNNVGALQLDGAVDQPPHACFERKYWAFDVHDGGVPVRFTYDEPCGAGAPAFDGLLLQVDILAESCDPRP